MKKLIRLVALLVLFVGLNKIALAEDKPSVACLTGKAELIGSCLDEAYTKWDKKLNDTYKSVMGYLSKDKKTELRNQQRTWLKERAKKCDGLSSEYAIKACNLDEAQLKVLALEDQEADLMPKLFEGDWRVKYGREKEYEGDYGAYDGFLILQKGKNVCGIWEYYATGAYGGQFHARLENQNIAQTTRSCGRPDAYTNTWCVYSEEEDSREKPPSEWDSSSFRVFKICENGQLYDTRSNARDGYLTQKGFVCDVMVKAPNLSDGLMKKNLLSAEREKFIKENPWINDCLNYKE